LKRPELYARLNPLFARRYKETLDKKVPGKALIKTTKLLKPEKKRQRVQIKVTQEQKQQLKKYWQIVVGEPIFKTRERLDAEREAVKAKVAQLEKEKAGLDLIENLDREAEAS